MDAGLDNGLKLRNGAPIERILSMGVLVIALWAIALCSGVFFPPVFIPAIYATYLWRKQVKRRKLAVQLSVATYAVKNGKRMVHNGN